MALMGLVLLALALADVPAWGALGALAFTVTRFPASLRAVRLRDPSIVLDGDRCVLRHGALRQPLEVDRAELHSIVPVWFGGDSSWQLRPVAPVVPHRMLPLLGIPKGRNRPALVFVLRTERRVPGRRRPLRGVIVAVEDLEAAQRAFQSWGLLARLTPGAFDWLLRGSDVMSPGPDPVYGT